MGYIAATLDLVKTAETYSLEPRRREKKTWDWLKWVLLGGAALGALGLAAKGHGDFVRQNKQYYRHRDMRRAALLLSGLGLGGVALAGGFGGDRDSSSTPPPRLPHLTNTLNTVRGIGGLSPIPSGLNLFQN